MRAMDVILWSVRENIDWEPMHILQVPEEGEHEWEQNEEWWFNNIGSCPPFPIPAGIYLYFLESSGLEPSDEFGTSILADQTIELGNDYINLYRLS